eukprot:509875_1
MGCSASDIDDDIKQEINTNNFSWSSYNFADAEICGKKYIFYKTKRHKQILVLRSYIRRFNINTEISDIDILINTIIQYITYDASYEHEGNKNETLIVENNTVVVLPSNGKRIYEFKSLHIQQYGILTVTKWIDCDYHNNIGGILNIYCHDNIIIDKNGMINLNGSGLTGLENDNVLTQYCGYNQTTKNTEGKMSINTDDEKTIELSIETSISKPTDLYEFKTYYIAKGGSYFKREKKNKYIRKTKKMYFGGIGGGCISLKCKDFINNGYVLSNGTNAPIKINKNNINNREILAKLKYFANNGQQTECKFNLKVIDVGIDGTGGFISIHVRDNFINNGLIEAMKFGEIIIVQTEYDPEGRTKLQFGKCNPFPKAQGAELKEIPTGELL